MEEKIYHKTEVKEFKLFENLDLDYMSSKETSEHLKNFISNNLNDKYDAIVFNESCSLKEYIWFKKVSDEIEHDIELILGDCFKCVEDLEIMSEDFDGLYSSEEIENGYEYLEVVDEVDRACKQMREHYGEPFTYKYIKKDFITSFARFFMLEENIWYCSHYNEINFKNILLFDSKYDENLGNFNLHNNEHSYDTKTFLNVYCPSKVTIIKLF